MSWAWTVSSGKPHRHGHLGAFGTRRHWVQQGQRCAHSPAPVCGALGLVVSIHGQKDQALPRATSGQDCRVMDRGLARHPDSTRRGDAALPGAAEPGRAAQTAIPGQSGTCGCAGQDHTGTNTSRLNPQEAEAERSHVQAQPEQLKTERVGV